MRTPEKTKIIMSKPDNPNEMVSRREVVVQDNPCTVTKQETSQNKTEPMVAMIDKLMSAVDNVSTKLGTIETRLLSLEGEAKNSTDSDCFVSGIQLLLVSRYLVWLQELGLRHGKQRWWGVTLRHQNRMPT